MKNTWQNIINSGQPFLIAEIGVNFFDIAKKENISPMEAAKLMIREAKNCGCGAAKFQSYKADKIASVYSPSYWDLTKEKTTSQHELFKKFDSFGEAEYTELKKYCDEQGILFLSTPFDFEAADYLDNLIPFFKVSSSDLNNKPFVEHIARKGKPMVISTGASSIEEVHEIVRIIENAGNKNINIMHCMLSYPTKNENANLNVIDHLRTEFPQHTVGYSDHTLPDENMIILTTAYLKGAILIEKHFTLDKTLPGNDHYHAADPDDIRRFFKNMELLHIVLGHNKRIIFDCEKKSRENARRSLIIKEDVKKGTVITKELLEIKRPGTGIEPMNFDKILGSTLLKDKKKDELLQWEDLQLK